MTVLREMGKLGVGTDGYEPSAVQQLFCVNHIGICIHVDAPLDCGTSIQKSPFLWADDTQYVQKFFAYHNITDFYCTRFCPCLQCK